MAKTTCEPDYSHPGSYVAPIALTGDVATLNVPELEAIFGGLSSPGKMPGTSYSIPTEECIVGSKLRAVPGSTCEFCYAHEHGAYAWKSTKAALARRFASLSHPLWARAFAERLNRIRGKKAGFHRWHDAGDLQSVEHLDQICDVARMSPDVKHWLPTREYRIVVEYVEAGNVIPLNLNVRLSAHMIGGRVPTFPRLRDVPNVTVSSVSREDGTFPDAHVCPSRHQNNTCGDCRACWDIDVEHVTYPFHY